MEPPARTDAIRRLVPRALWWFRWAADVDRSASPAADRDGAEDVSDYFKSIQRMAIFLGIIFGLAIFGNVLDGHLAEPSGSSSATPSGRHG